MSKFHKLTIADIKQETPDCISIAFEIPSALEKEFQFVHGQHLTFKLLIDSNEFRRSYSICTSPLEKEPIRVAVKRMKNGIGSNYINNSLKVGDSVEVMTPMGNFHTELKDTNRKRYVLFAGGSGITPMLSIIRTTLIAEPQSRITLFYGNFSEIQTIFKKELDKLMATHPDRLSIHYIFEKPEAANYSKELIGVMSIERVKALVLSYLERNPVTEYFICGPTIMMDNVKKVLEDMNVNKHFIHIEYFTTFEEPKKEGMPQGTTELCEVTVIMDGKETAFPLSGNGKAILDAAMDAGVDAPFSCKGAVCATCRAKLKEGKVSMDMNYALTDEEVEEGYILTCQSHPVTPVVVVDYDQG